MTDIASQIQHYLDRNDLGQLEGSHRTAIPGVHIYRASQGSPRQPFVYQSGIIFMGQGRKRIHLNGQQVDYGPGRYLVQGVPLPLECEAYSDNNLPLLGLSVSINTAMLQELLTQLESPEADRLKTGHRDCSLTSDHLTPTITNTLQRLLDALINPQEAKILGVSIVRELIYRILIGPKGHVLTELAHHDSHYARIARVLVHIHQHFADPLTVESLAEQANMSASGFHRAFRQVTRETPLQYLKKLRLIKARDLMRQEGRRANEAARLVGYRSASQFSREFKRHFKQVASHADTTKTPAAAFPLAGTY